MSNFQRAAKTIAKVYVKGPFRRAHLAALLLGGFFGGIVGTIVMSGDQGQRHWSLAVLTFIIGAVVGASITVSLVPAPSSK